MNSNFFDSALRATHRVIVIMRYLGYKNTDPQLLARILDHADPLGFMLMNDFRPESGEELPSLFRAHLQEIEEKFEGFTGLTASFDANMRRGESVPGQTRELAAANA